LSEQRLVFGLPAGLSAARSGVRFYLGTDVDLPGVALTWETVDASLREWFDTVGNVPLLENHKPTVNYGRVADFRIQENPNAPGTQALFFVVEPDAQTLPLHDAGKVSGFSPAVELNYTDHTGKIWPIVMSEGSYTEQPRIIRGVPNSALLGAQFADGKKMTPEEIEALAELVATKVVEKMKPVEIEMSETPAASEAETLKAELNDLRGKVELQTHAKRLKCEFSDATANAFLALRTSNASLAVSLLDDAAKHTAPATTGTTVKLPSTAAAFSDRAGKTESLRTLSNDEIAKQAAAGVTAGKFKDFAAGVAAITAGA